MTTTISEQEEKGRRGRAREEGKRRACGEEEERRIWEEPLVRQNTSAREDWEVGIPGCNLNMAVIFP